MMQQEIKYEKAIYFVRWVRWKRNLKKKENFFFRVSILVLEKQEVSNFTARWQ